MISDARLSNIYATNQKFITFAAVVAVGFFCYFAKPLWHHTLATSEAKYLDHFKSGDSIWIRLELQGGIQYRMSNRVYSSPFPLIVTNGIQTSSILIDRQDIIIQNSVGSTKPDGKVENVLLFAVPCKELVKEATAVFGDESATLHALSESKFVTKVNLGPMIFNIMPTDKVSAIVPTEAFKSCVS